MHLLNPKKLAQSYPDEETKQIMLKTIEFFEAMGLAKIKADYESRRWYTEFLDFIKKDHLYSRRSFFYLIILIFFSPF